MTHPLLRVKPAVRRAALIGYWITMFLATHWPNIDRYRPERGWPLPFFDFFLHVGVYCLWTLLWFWVLLAHVTIRQRTYVLFFVVGLLYAIFDEGTQAFVDRTPTVSDLGYNLIGMGLGLVLSARVIRGIRSGR